MNDKDDNLDELVAGCLFTLIFIVIVPIVAGMQMGYYGHRVTLAAKLQYSLGFVVCACVIWAVINDDLDFWTIFLLPPYMILPYLIGVVLRPNRPNP